MMSGLVRVPFFVDTKGCDTPIRTTMTLISRDLTWHLTTNVLATVFGTFCTWSPLRLNPANTVLLDWNQTRHCQSLRNWGVDPSILSGEVSRGPARQTTSHPIVETAKYLKYLY